MIIKNDTIKVLSVCAAVSNNWVSNSGDGDNSKASKFIKKIGVEGRYVSGSKQCASDFCTVAAESIIREKGINKDDIGVIIFVTQSADYRDPAGAMVIQHRLGISDDCIVFDINLGCSGFVCGLSVAGSLLRNSTHRYALLLCGETAARERDPNNPRLKNNADTKLFGDAGTATLLEKDDECEGITVSVKSDGNRFDKIVVPYGFYRNPSYPENSDGDVYMDEIGVFNFSTTEVPELINEYMGMKNTTPESYDYIVLHQANKYIMDRIVKKIGFPNEKSLVSIDRFGNTSSASIPLTLVNSFGETDEKKDIKVLCSGYGVGLSWAVTEFMLNTADILPLVHTDEYFEDGFGIEEI